MSKIIFLLFAFLFLFLVALIVAGEKQKNSEYITVCLRSRCFEAEVADTESERAKGLMFRKNLDANKGMLFIFKEEGRHSFWMKNTLIPLDIIWLNKNREVVFIKENLQPCQEQNCPAIAPDKEAKYVLELNANISDKIGVQVGDEVTFK